jgi:hypothetical protein
MNRRCHADYLIPVDGDGQVVPRIGKEFGCPAGNDGIVEVMWTFPRSAGRLHLKSG